MTCVARTHGNDQRQAFEFLLRRLPPPEDAKPKLRKPARNRLPTSSRPYKCQRMPIAEEEDMLANRIKDGIYSGVAGGIVFGVMMAAMGMLPMIGGMIGIPSAWAGFLIHLSISALIGGSFGFVADRLGLEGGLPHWSRVWSRVVAPWTTHADAPVHGDGPRSELEPRRHDPSAPESRGPSRFRRRAWHHVSVAPTASPLESHAASRWHGVATQRRGR